MVLMQRVTLCNTRSTAATLLLGLSHAREWAATDAFASGEGAEEKSLFFGTERATLLSVQGAPAREQSSSVKNRTDKDGKVIGTIVAGQARLAVDVPAGQSRQVMVTLPSAPVDEPDRRALLSLDYESARSATITFWSDWLSRKLLAEIEMPARGRPRALLLRLRHPEGKPIRSVTVNGRGWTDFDVQKEWVRIVSPGERRYSVAVSY
jgi:hypothetical protein